MPSQQSDAARWIAERMQHIEASGIRKVMALAKSLKNPVDLSIGQPHFDVPEPVKSAARAAMDRGANGYTVTQGIPELRERIQKDIDKRYGHADRQVLITSGTSGGVFLAIFCAIDPGDEVVVFDPYFVMYPQLVSLAGGTPVLVDTYPDFRINAAKVEEVLSPRTKAIIVNSPANPTGIVQSADALGQLALLAKERRILLLSDEVYRSFCYDGPFCSPAESNDQALVFDGFSKSYGMTGWRLGFAHGPAPIIEEMTKLQQFSFVCAPSIVQHAGVAAWEYDVSSIIADYRRKRDRMYQALRASFDVARPEGAFYMFPRAPSGTASDFVAEAIRNNLLIIPGKTFSRQDSHFRLSYAADDVVLERGIEILNRLSHRR